MMTISPASAIAAKTGLSGTVTAPDPMKFSADSSVAIGADWQGQPIKLAARRSRGLRRSLHAASLVEQDVAGTGSGVSSAQAPGRSKLANGPDLRQGCWSVEVLYRAVDKSGANTAAIVEQDHRAVKRITRPMLGFKTFRCVRILLAGIEVMHMIRKGQLGAIKDRASSVASPFYSLAFRSASASQQCLLPSSYCDRTFRRTCTSRPPSRSGRLRPRSRAD